MKYLAYTEVAALSILAGDMAGKGAFGAVNANGTQRWQSCCSNMTAVD